MPLNGGFVKKECCTYHGTWCREKGERVLSCCSKCPEKNKTPELIKCMSCDFTSTRLAEMETHSCVAPAEESDWVKKPKHYTQHPKGIECIEVIEDSPHFNLGQAIRYIWRVNWGGKWNDLEDLEKAKQYLDFEISRRKRGLDAETR